jgi:hypothetical protein
LLARLFVKEDVLKARDSYLSYAVKFVKQQHIFAHSSEDAHSVYVPDPSSIINDMLGHMKTWVASLSKSLKAEFPCFEILQCYAVFQVPRPSQRSSSSRLRRDREELADDKIRTRLRRLAVFYSVNADTLMGDYFRLRHLPKCLVGQDPSLSSFEAWKLAMRRARKRMLADGSGPYQVLHEIFLRFAGTAGSTTCVESGLGRSTDVLHSRRSLLAEDCCLLLRCRQHVGQTVQGCRPKGWFV